MQPCNFDKPHLQATLMNNLESIYYTTILGYISKQKTRYFVNLPNSSWYGLKQVWPTNPCTGLNSHKMINQRTIFEPLKGNHWSRIIKYTLKRSVLIYANVHILSTWVFAPACLVAAFIGESFIVIRLSVECFANTWDWAGVWHLKQCSSLVMLRYS